MRLGTLERSRSLQPDKPGRLLAENCLIAELLSSLICETKKTKPAFQRHYRLLEKCVLFIMLCYIHWMGVMTEKKVKYIRRYYNYINQWPYINYKLKCSLREIENKRQKKILLC